MKLYHNGDVWQLPGKQDKKAIKVEVPTAAADLAEFLNARHVPAGPIETDDMDEEEFSEFVEKHDPPINMATAAIAAGLVTGKPTYAEQFAAARQAERQTQFRTDEIVDFLYDTASVNQVSQIHAAIGTRFAEAIKSQKGE